MDYVIHKLVGGLNLRAWRPGFLAKWLAGPMASLFLVCLLLSAVGDGWLQSVLIELAITFLGVLITVFYVDEIVRRREEQRWAGTRSVAATRVKRIVARMIVAVSESHPDEARALRYQIRPWMTRAWPGGEYLADLYGSDEWLDFVRDLVIPNTKQIIERMDRVTLENLEWWLQRTLERLQETLTLFPGALNPAQLEQILTMIEELPVEKRAVNHRIGQAPNQLEPNPAGLLRRCLILIEISDQDRVAGDPPGIMRVVDPDPTWSQAPVDADVTASASCRHS